MRHVNRSTFSKRRQYRATRQPFDVFKAAAMSGDTSTVRQKNIFARPTIFMSKLKQT
ncbi:MAG: hypothetical protein IJ774_00180 [Selenomonadaceae bacterium]|nr:hypothetical protein [Selenomonadaceae bacterium]